MQRESVYRLIVLPIHIAPRVVVVSAGRQPVQGLGIRCSSSVLHSVFAKTTDPVEQLQRSVSKIASLIAEDQINVASIKHRYVVRNVLIKFVKPQVVILEELAILRRTAFRHRSAHRVLCALPIE